MTSLIMEVLLIKQRTSMVIGTSSLAFWIMADYFGARSDHIWITQGVGGSCTVSCENGAKHSSSVTVTEISFWKQLSREVVNVVI